MYSCQKTYDIDAFSGLFMQGALALHCSLSSLSRIVTHRGFVAFNQPNLCRGETFLGETFLGANEMRVATPRCRVRGATKRLILRARQGADVARL